MGSRAKPHVFCTVVMAAFLCTQFGCTRSHGPFGFSRHPLSHRQIEAMLGDFPNPGPNTSNTMRDAAGNVVRPPADFAAYTSRLVVFEPGYPPALIEGSDPREALGKPNYTDNIREPPHAVSLGNGGAIVLELAGDPLMDVPGPELFVFESGPSPEAVEVEVSPDGEHWVFVGVAPGGAFALDIGPKVNKADTFRYVRIRDVKDSGPDNGPWLGAEIDAIAALRSKPSDEPPPPKMLPRIALSSEVLFRFDSDSLGPEGPAELDRVAKMLAGRPNCKLSIEGHTDDIGDEVYNLDLSERRAQTVRAYLVTHGLLKDNVVARGFGESKPTVQNDSDEHRRRNRRVEIVLQEGCDSK